MAKCPTFGGDPSKGFVWIKLIASWAMVANCDVAFTAGEPVKRGGGKSAVELERHSKINIPKAQIAWQCLLDEANNPLFWDVGCRLSVRERVTVQVRGDQESPKLVEGVSP